MATSEPVAPAPAGPPPSVERSPRAQRVEVPEVVATISTEAARTERLNLWAARIVARAIVFSALLFVGLGVVALIAFGDLDWVVLLTGYGVFVVWAIREFF